MVEIELATPGILKIYSLSPIHPYQTLELNAIILIFVIEFLTEIQFAESEGFFDGILNHLFASKPLELPEFYELNKVSKYSLDGIVISKYFERSRAHYLEDELKLKRIYEINKPSNKYPNREFVNKKRMLLWYSVNTSSKGSDQLNKILNNGISYENGKMARALYFRDRIKRFIKYCDYHFGILLLCEVAVGNT